MGKKDKTGGKHKKFKFSNLLLLFVIMCIAAFAVFRLSLKSKLRGRFATIRKAGYPVNCQELDDWYKLPDGADNAAYIILDAFSFFNKWDRSELEAVPLAGRAKLPARTEPLTDESKVVIEKYLDDNKEALELLHKAANIEYSRYPVDLSLGNSVQMNHFSDMRFGAQILSLEALLHTENEKSQSAVESIKTGLGIERSLNLEPTLISQMVRIACHALTISVLERVMSRTELTDGQLVELDRVLAKTRDPEAILRGIVGERCFTLELMSHPQPVSAEIVDGIPSVPILELYSALGMTDWDTLLYIDYTNEYMEIAKLPVHERLTAAKEIAARQAKISKVHILLRMLSSALSRYIEIDLRAAAHLRTAQVAVAVERYRLNEGKLPDKLIELVPAYLEAVPEDPFDGKKIRYKKLSSGFVVYSIGPDLSDDGGREQPSDQKERRKNPKWDVTFIVER